MMSMRLSTETVKIMALGEGSCTCVGPKWLPVKINQIFCTFTVVADKLNAMKTYIVNLYRGKGLKAGPLWLFIEYALNFRNSTRCRIRLERSPRMRKVGCSNPSRNILSRTCTCINRWWQLHFLTLSPRRECHRSSKMTIVNGGSVSQ